MTTEERVNLALHVAEGFSTDVKKIQEIQLDMQARIDEIFSALSYTKMEGNERDD